VPAVAELLRPAGRDRLAVAARMIVLAASARQAAAGFSGDVGLAWTCVAYVLNTCGDTAEAREVLSGMVDSTKLRSLAISCIDALTSDGTNAVTNPQKEVPPVSDLTILDEVNPGALTEASMLIRQVLEHEADLDAFHALEDQIRPEWMPQALACIAAYLVDELAEAQNKVRSDPEKVTPPQMLTEAINLIMHTKDRRDRERYQ
jgi:hypothetical protein